jgi:hypothetical protein
MSLIDNLLGRQNVQQLAPEQQQQARSEAYRQFILGTLFGGRGLASGYAATQQVIPTMQASQQRQRQVAALESSMVPTAVRPGSQIDMLQQQMGEPQLGAQTVEALQRNARGTGFQGTGLTEAQQFVRRFDPMLYAQNAPAVMDPSKPQDILSASKAGAGQVVGGLVVNPFDPRQILGSLPQEKDGVVTQFDPASRQTFAQPVVNFAESRPVAVETNQMVVGGRVVNAPGAVQATTESTTAQTLAERGAQAEFEDVTYINEAGDTVTETRAEYMRKYGLMPGQPTPQGVPQAQPAGGRVTQLGAVGQARMAQYGRDLEAAGLQANAARQRQATYDRLKQVFSDPNFDPTNLTPVRAQLTGLLRGLGVTGPDADNFLRQFRTAEQAVNRLTLDTLPELVGAISNFEIGYVGSTQPRITDSRDSALFNIAVLEAAGERARQRQEFLLNNPSPDALIRWEQSDRGSRELFDNPSLLPFIKKYSAPEDRRVVTDGPQKGKTAYRMPSGRFRVID